MRVALIIYGFLPVHIGGTEVATYHIARHLINEGHEVHIITIRDSGLPKEEITDGIYIHRVSNRFRQRRVTNWLFRLGALKKIAEINPDIIHCQDIWSGIIGLASKRLLGKPYIACGQGTDIYSSWKHKKTVTKIVSKNADAVIALTEDMRKRLLDIYKREVYIVPNGIELARFEGISRENTRKNLGIKSNEKIILFVGTLRPVKGVKYLIKAMKTVFEKQHDARLFIVGSGKEEESLRTLARELNIEKQITFVGRVENELVPEYMAAADIFVLPSLREGMSVVILEAMASGLPIITTDTCGMSEIIRDGRNGLLVEPKKPEQLAEKILLLLQDENLRREISTNNKENARKYNWENITAELKKIYYKVLGK